MITIKENKKSNKKHLHLAKGTAHCQFLFWLSRSMHTEVKIRAAHRNITMGHWIVQAIMQRIANEERFEEKKEKENGK